MSQDESAGRESKGGAVLISPYLGGSGGGISPINSVPAELGSAPPVEGSGSTPGGTIIVSELPGNLGNPSETYESLLLKAESYRENARLNGLTPINIRFRGHREANKFNLMMQKLVTLCAGLFLTLRSANSTLETREAVNMYPTDTEISNIYHIQAQIAFKEWLLLKDDDKRWYT